MLFGGKDTFFLRKSKIKGQFFSFFHYILLAQSFFPLSLRKNFRQMTLRIPHFLLLASLAISTVSCRREIATEQVARPADSIIVDTLTEVPSLMATSPLSEVDADFVLLSDVCPDIIQEIRYFTTYNFVGQRIPGYERPVAYLTRQAADSLKLVCDDLMKQGYRLKIFDAYRPQMAVDFFIRWGRDLEDQRMKEYFYPECPKSELFRRGYLARHSGHSRGSTIDLTLFDMKTEREVDMGGTYDLLGEPSHFNYTKGLSQEQIRHRHILREAMVRHGFKPISVEWWHFTLRNEPYPNRYFNFPVK